MLEYESEIEKKKIVILLLKRIITINWQNHNKKIIIAKKYPTEAVTINDSTAAITHITCTYNVASSL